MIPYAGSCIIAALCLLFHQARSLTVTGISANVDNATGQRPFRRDINQLSTSGPPWDLFILALRDFQHTSQYDPLSYYQIAGIHGLPNITWDGVGGPGDAPGYCVHGAVTFPPWHRPYLALFEQILWKHAQRIAQSYPSEQRETYAEAALDLRIPYWDAFADAKFPSAASSPTVRVQTPNGTQFVDNPLYNYTFHADEGGNPFPADHWMSQLPWTVRQWEPSSGQSNMSKIDADLKSQRANMLGLTYKLLASETNYTRMSSTSFDGSSLEYIHNLVHNTVGGRGHMSETATSAFDPIFWLHHANVDRLFAMWQAINPKSWVVPTTNTVGTFALLRGSMESGNTALQPFHSGDGTNFWTSDLVHSTHVFGYTYPDLMDWKVSPEQLASSVRENINRVYDSAAVDIQARRRSALSRSKAELAMPQAGDGSTVPKHESRQQWTITLKLQRTAYQGPFFIDFFVGIPPADPRRWATATNLVGSHAHFISARSGGIRMIDNRETLSHGEVSLTPFLARQVRHGTLADLEPSCVIPFLAKALNWRARDMEGCEVAVESLAALSIAVGSQIIKPTKLLDEFPRFGKLSLYSNITSNKPGGVGERQATKDDC